MDDFIDIILENIPSGVFVLNQDLEIKFCNQKAIHFLNRFELPDEITSVSTKIFQAIDQSNLREAFPGEIYITKKFDGSPSNWIFRIFISEEPKPFVQVHIIEEPISNKLDLNKTRQQFKLTRRETDVLRRVLDGLKDIEIAEELDAEEQTIKDHLNNIYRKTGFQDRSALVSSLLNDSI